MRTLGIIPARGGSKGIKRKNMRSFSGSPLLFWTVQAAEKSSLLSDFIVSSDDDEILAYAKSIGARAVKRPAHLATDEATTVSVVKQIADEHPNFDAYVILQPTSPLRSEGFVDKCIHDFFEASVDCLASGFMHKSLPYATHNNLRRQDVEGNFIDDGSIYILSRDLAASAQWTGPRVRKVVQDKPYILEIDDEVDWQILESLFNKYKGASVHV